MMADLDREDLEELISCPTSTPTQVAFGKLMSPALEILSPEELVATARLAITGLALWLEGDSFSTYSSELRQKTMHTILDLLKESVKLHPELEDE